MAQIAAVTRVWINEGCIACDACRTVCPEVFRVEGEICVIRPEVTSETLRDRGAAVLLAAEECPTQVIAYETATLTDEGPGSP